jgi:tetratricopeptide (TPR) repeat protein
MHFDRGQEYEAMRALKRSCAVEASTDNKSYLAASEVLFENGYVVLAKEYLLEGVKKGYRIEGSGFINNGRLYNNLGLILAQEGNYPKALEAFQ